MKKRALLTHSKSILTVIALIFSINIVAQYQSPPQSRSPFWDKVQYGGGIGMSFGSGYTDISLAPSAIYNVNTYLGVGLGVQGSYVSSKDYYNSTIYGASIITLINPLPQIQLSVTLNESRVNNNYKTIEAGNYSDNFWNTALFLGAGYRTGNVTIGLTYNVLFDVNDNVYGDALMPFVRAYF